MPRRPPRLITIARDDYLARWIGRMSDGRQFFLTCPFVPAIGGDRGSEFLALYVFDGDGLFAHARIEDMGPRSDASERREEEVRSEWLSDLGRYRLGRIRVAPFRIEHQGVSFGLVLTRHDDGEWSVNAQPGDYMEFTSPWGSGEYDT